MLLKKKKEKEKILLVGSCHCKQSPARGTVSDTFMTSFIQLDTDRNSEAIKPTHGFLHAPLLPRRPLFFPHSFFFFSYFICYKGFSRKDYKLLHFHRHFSKQNYSFVTGLSLFIKKRLHEYRI